jgi:hypothetical protein
MLASEVTPGLLAGAEPDAHQFYVTIFEWGDRMDKDSRRYNFNSGNRAWYVESKGGLDPTSVSKLIKGW